MKNKQKLILELRALTSAGISDCYEALKDSGSDLQKAVDLIKQRGKSLVTGKKIAAEGLVKTMCFGDQTTIGMIEVNCVTDFVARSPEFTEFCDTVLKSMYAGWLSTSTWIIPSNIEEARQQLASVTKENIDIRRWWVEQFLGEHGKVFSYVHPNPNEGKIGVLLNMQAETDSVLNSEAFYKLGDELAMQAAAMSPLAVSPDKLDLDVVSRQTSIFEAQVAVLNKPEQVAIKITEGKLNKWYKEVCLLNQESVLHPKKSCKSILQEAEKEAGGKITVVNLIRCQVGEGIEVQTEDLADEAVKLVNS